MNERQGLFLAPPPAGRGERISPRLERTNKFVSPRPLGAMLDSGGSSDGSEQSEGRVERAVGAGEAVGGAAKSRGATESGNGRQMPTHPPREAVVGSDRVVREDIGGGTSRIGPSEVSVAAPLRVSMETRDGVFSMSGSLVAHNEFSHQIPTLTPLQHKTPTLSHQSPVPVSKSGITLSQSSSDDSSRFTVSAVPRPANSAFSPPGSPNASRRAVDRFVPVGGLRQSRSRSGSLQVPPSDPVSENLIIPFVYEGSSPCTMVEVLLAVGAPVAFGSELAIVEMEKEEMLHEEPAGYVQNSASDKEEDNGSSSEELARGGGNYLGEEDSVEPEDEKATLAHSEEQVSILIWEGSEGMLSEWCVKVGESVQPGQTIAKVRLSARLAHLIQADQYAQLIRSERTDWGSGLNARFQNLTENLVRAIASGSREVVHSAETLKTCTDLERVARDFMDTARTYGKVIISEMHLPVEAKTVRPLKLGGVLGGSKYVVRDVLFKLGNGDVFSEYPDPLYIANKIQGHELKGLKAYFATFFNKGSLGLVSFPLMTIIDYKGHRITAMSELPISGKDSLILGSMNAGTECNVMNKDPVFSAIVNEASQILGLKPHYVTNGKSQKGEIEISHCVDLEGHLGKDGKKYLLDFSRTFPPAYKEPEKRPDYDKFWPFYHMLRGEFLSRYQVFSRLSSDAYSTFQSPLRPEEKSQNHQDIKEASMFLRTQVVLNVCNSLKDLSQGGDVAQALSLPHVFHREGLNIRYLGLVYHKMVHEMYSQLLKNVYKEIIAEGLMRILKNHLRSQLRKADGESTQLSVVRNVLNAFFGRSADEVEWIQHNDFVLDQLMGHFSFDLRDARHCIVTFRSNSSIQFAGGESLSIKYVVLRRLSEAAGLTIDEEVMRDLKMTNASIRGRGFEGEAIFEDLDFTFTERVKQLDVIQRAFGLAQYLKGVQVMSQDPGAAEQFFLRGFFMVEKTLEASPLDPWLAALMGDLSSGLWMVMNAQCSRVEMSIGRTGSSDSLRALQEAREVAKIFSVRAERYYQEAVSASPVVSVLRNFAIYMLRHNRIEEAEGLLARALAACNDEGGTLNGQLLSEWELVAEIQDLQAECASVRGGVMRKQSVQFSGGVLLPGPASRSSHLANVRKDSIGAKVKKSLRRAARVKESVSGGLRKSSGSSASDKAPTNARASVSSGPVPISINVKSVDPLAPDRALGKSGFLVESQTDMEVDAKADQRLTSGRNRLLLQRLKGGHAE